MIFTSVADARQALGIPEEIHMIYVRDHPDSIESRRPDGQVIKVIGKGILKSPGHPGGNQSIEGQRNLMRAIIRQIYLPIFIVEIDNAITYMGNYYLARYDKKTSFAGFAYYEFTMHRCRRLPPWTYTLNENNPINTVDETADLIEQPVHEYSSSSGSAATHRVVGPALVESRACLPACRFNPWK
jgi:hypothetical protein